MIIFGDDGMRHLMHDDGDKKTDNRQNPHELICVRRLAMKNIGVDFYRHRPTDQDSQKEPARIGLHLEAEETKQRYAFEGHLQPLTVSNVFDIGDENYNNDETR